LVQQQHLTALRTLELQGCACDAACLRNATALTSFMVKSTQWASPATLFSWLQQQQQLVHLSVAGLPLEAADNGPSFAAAAFTASPLLEQLHLSGQQLHKAAWQPLLSHPLLQLHTLLLATAATLDRQDATMAEADVQAMAQCCPALQTLVGESVLNMQGALRGLTRLTRLTAMQARARRRSATAAATVSVLTRLRQLELVGEASNGRKWHCHDFRSLRCLTQLTAVKISCRGEPGLLDQKPSEALLALTTLERLDLGGAKLSEQQLRSMSGLAKLTHLSFAKGRGDSVVLGDLALARLQRIGTITQYMYSGLSNVVINSTVSTEAAADVIYVLPATTCVVLQVDAWPCNTAGPAVPGKWPSITTKSCCLR
jgi:hypothetical protein